MTVLAAIPQYETYKDSGIEWLGKIPTHWTLKKITHVFSTIGSGTTPATGNASFYDGDIAWLQTGDLTDGLISATSKKITEKALKIHSSLKKYKVGSLVIAMYGATIGKVGLLAIETTTNQACCVLEKNQVVDMRYMLYLFMGFKNNIVSMAYGGGQPNISQDLIRNLRFPYPEKEEQTAIAHFLDQKTAQIDAAIAIKEKQIALLKERKQTLIQQAVTRGVGFDFAQPTGSDRSLSEAEGNSVPMKDSGVEWIGKIPAHWNIYANRVLFSERIEPGREDLPLLSVSIHSGVSSEEISEEENIRGRIKIEDKKKYLLVKAGDIAFNMMRAWQGAIGAVRTEGMVSPAYIVAKPKSYISAEYFEYQYRCPDFIKQMDRFSKGITDFRKRLYWDGFKQLYTIVPPQNEQSQIEIYIQAETEKTNESINLLNQQIEKLREYKTTLINSAVTGKIRVTPEMVAV